MFEWREYAHFHERSPSGTGVFPHSMSAGTGGFEGVLACSNPRCQAGGFELDFLVESMISDQVKERSGVLVCIGWEREQDSGSQGSPCTRAISYRMRIGYRGRTGQATQKEANGHGS